MAAIPARAAFAMRLLRMAPTRLQLTELLAGCLLIIRGGYPVGHFSVTVQDFPVTIAFRGRAIFESFAGLTVSHQHF
jgi:hypothetical protein